MKIKEIIELLCDHEISKHEAIDKITAITDGLRKKEALEFTVEKVAFSSQNDHGLLELKLPYQYAKMKGVKRGDKVDVVIIP